MKTWFLQGVLNEQFVQLEKLEEIDSPNFVEEVLTIYFDESDKLISDVEQELQAEAASNAVNPLQEQQRMLELIRSNAAFQQMKREQDNLKNKLETYFQLKGQVPDNEEGQGSNE
ncbi:hypothetical protein RJ639_024585 [Escallonia herrerae]|uniref:Histidine-containing phosphotransfer protein n=1 Tax=Escallonia herrerae TaxID=1293975 RepID=A0AA88UYS6_9ASTE|nr:hypothetical protein RJ639_024585 [Escallonia herrerae]